MLALDKAGVLDFETLKLIEPEQLTFSDGKTYTIRQVRPSDFEPVKKFLRELSQHSNLMRYFIPAPTLPEETVHDDALRVLRPNPALQITLVASQILDDGEEIILGIAELAREKSLPPNQYEVGVVIADAYQGKGLGLVILKRLIALARRRGIKKLQATMLAENWPIRKLLTKLDLASEFHTSHGETYWEAKL